MPTSKIPIIFCIDVEPVDRLIDRKTPTPWRGYEATVTYLSHQRERIERVTGSPVHYTWFYRMDPQVEETYGRADWIIDNYPDLAEEFLEHGDELGLHIHVYRWDSQEQTWIVDHGNQPWINQCLDLGFNAFQTALGFPCETFRMGDRFMNNHTMTELNRHGVLYDLTVEPGSPTVPALNLTETYTGFIPDHRGIAYKPYQPCPNDWRKPNTPRQNGLIEIPMSTGWGIPEQPSQTWAAKSHRVLKHLLGRPWKPWHPFETVNLGRPSSSICQIIDHLIDTIEKPYIACMIRSSTCYSANKRAEMEATLEHILSHPRARDFVLATPREALEYLAMNPVIDVEEAKRWSA